MSGPATPLSVAVTGPTGTFGFGLVPLLEASPQVARIVGIARREFKPSQHGWTKLEYRRGDVRDEENLREAFRGMDVVVHLAFMITGNASADTIRAINIDGTLNALHAARDTGAERFVYPSSVAAYGRAMTAGIAGLAYESRLGSMSTSVQGGNLVLYAVAAAVIGGTSLFGGRGKPLHALLGGIIIATVVNGLGLMGVSDAVQFIATAIVLIAAVTLDAVVRRRAGTSI